MKNETNKSETKRRTLEGIMSTVFLKKIHFYYTHTYREWIFVSLLPPPTILNNNLSNLWGGCLLFLTHPCSTPNEGKLK